ncbi:4-alpha-glucanotransferase [Vibrio parahaemolyticus]|uniref:4-alpha-glucanotransferase n=1 Tax=Vibrio parahaemolyticus TaxID=670 RepID=UPI000472FBC3|nr:4-alpha-glucanotransferase [Vibrio parahaemolyticus]EGQ7813187.1 4-alpha-glucanotransferase [Vibrio parahaemolyticus]EGQ8732232.1 4-alpha-glucanotransferase [Vibrio parahaemolyticus]EGQ8886490.1 4-alpha-glucanotransferase [Vibrio parahaemolyticus]EGQ8914920.1 4-alpha-glucanotransferase [Vibrio parahaemolyticus]EGQ8934635.1 4-alpha-glucanotransferase [Vibrio parahaemolyticus]
MKEQTALKKVAEMARLADSYVSAWGDEAKVSDETLRRLLTSLGYDTSSDEKLLVSAEKKHKKDVLAPVLVLRDGEPVEVELNLGTSARESEFSWRLETEQGEVLEGYLQSQIVRDERAEGGPLVFALPKNLAWGYHKLIISRKRRKTPYEMSLIITPKACFKQEDLNQHKKLWGPSIQLYTLRTQHNWGIGDFGDLKQLVSDIASRGGDFIGLNPIHSLFPANPEGASPYSPSSRRWLNIMYIDVSSVPEFALSAEAQQRVGSAEFQQRLQKARDSHWVNYTEVSQLKMSVLPLLFSEFKARHLDKNTDRARAFLDFVEKGGESLLHQAAFDALHADLHAEDSGVWGWPVFPEKYRTFDAAGTQKYIKDNQDRVHLYMYLQWIADDQIKEAQALAEEKGMAVGLYRDLAVGVADSGSETWADEGNLVLDASIGAPPDILGPLGQNWGLPPLNPQVLEATGYDAYIKLLRANMKHCGALRIDHVLGLLRLWWIPKGEKATEGAYLYYPVEDMLAILALESHRHQCSVIGEDLGTVPDEIVDILRDAGVHSYKVFFFETSKEDGGFISPKHYAEQSMAALCTHDMPTLRGFWHCDDLKMGREIGLYPDEKQLEGLFADRLKCKQGILDSVRWHGYLPEGIGHDAQFVPMDSYLSEALQLHVAAGDSALLSVQLEDWLEMDQPVNIPGTVNEYPNWRRKLSMNLDEIFSREDVNRISKRLTEVRAQASK